MIIELNENSFNIKKYNFELTSDPIIFLETVSKKIICEIIGYYNDFRENPLQFRERTLTSVIFPALLKSSKRAATELYYYTKSKEKVNFLDYYAMDELGENAYLIEVKHLFLHNNESFRKYYEDKWIELEKQFKKLKKRDVNNHIDSNKNIYAISLAIIVPWFYSEKEKSIDYFKNYVKEKFNPDWLYACDLRESNVYKIEFSDKDIYYPWIIFTERIKTIETAKN